MWRWLKDHPEHTAKQISTVFNVEVGRIASTLSDLTVRDMVVRTSMSRPKGQRGPIKLWVYSVNPRLRGEYEILTRKARLTDRKVGKHSTPMQHQVPSLLMQLAQAPAVEVAHVAQVNGEMDDDQWVEQTIETMSLLRGQMLYQRLKAIFQQ